MSVVDEATRLRCREFDLLNACSRENPGPAAGAICLAARTTTLLSYPNAASRFYACNPVTVLGTEVEGGAGTKTLGAPSFLALNLGAAVPPAGTEVLVTFVNNRWVFRYDG